MAWRMEHGAVGIAMRGQGEVRHRGAWECETARRRPGCSSIFVDESRRRCAAFADAPKEPLNKSSIFSSDTGKVCRAGGGIRKT